MEGRAVAVEAVTLVPLVVLPQRVVHAHAIPVGAERRERGLDSRGKQQPVVERRRNHARGLERRDQVLLRRGVKGITKRRLRSQQALREERGVDERLPFTREVQEIGRAGIDGAGDRAARQVGVLGSHFALWGTVRRYLDPRRKPREQPPQRFEMRDVPAIGSGRLLHGHPRLQRASREVPQHRIR